MKFFNHELGHIANFILHDLHLSGKQNRMRMKFLKILTQKQSDFNEYHMELIREYANLDDEGNPKIIEKDGKGLFDIRDLNNFQEAFIDLANEEVVIEENEENRDFLLSLKESLNNCDTVLQGEKAAIHDYLCEKFDNIYLDKHNEITIS